jgi:two-component system response regulator FixJ
VDARPSLTVVLVEDDPALLSALSFAFDIEGYAVRAFPTAGAALAADLSDAACLVVDYGLPDLSGLDLLHRLRADGCMAPALLITSNPPAAVVSLAALMGVSVIEKPLLSDDLVDSVRKLAPPPGSKFPEA